MSRFKSEQGSVLVLVPAGLLVLMILAALSVDSAVAYLGQRQLRDALSIAASDSVTAGLNNEAFYRHGTISLDQSATEQSVCESLATQNLSALHQMRIQMAISGDSIRLVAEAKVDAVFGRSIPGYGQRSVRASADAVVASGPAAITGSADSLVGVATTPLQC